MTMIINLAISMIMEIGGGSCRWLLFGGACGGDGVEVAVVVAAAVVLVR